MDTPSEIAYNAYAASTGGLTYDGRQMPAWADLGQRIQHAWACAAQAVLDAAEPGTEPRKPLPSV